jgi:hypothetical protein
MAENCCGSVLVIEGECLLGLPGPRQELRVFMGLGPARDHALEHVSWLRQGFDPVQRCDCLKIVPFRGKRLRLSSCVGV